MTSRATTQTLGADAKWTAASVCGGAGVIVEGTLEDLHMHTVQRAPAGSDLPTRFVVLRLAVDRATVRKWQDGVEVLPDQTKTKVVVRGYLTREKTVCRPEGSGTDAASAARIVATALGHAPAALFPSGAASGAAAGAFEFWADAAAFVVADFVRGRRYRLKTRGDSPLVESATRIDGGTEKDVLAYYAGGDGISTSWNATIDRAAKAHAAPAPTALPGPEDERDDSEWD